MQPQTLVVTPVYCTRENQRLPLLLQNLYWVRQQTDRNFRHVIVDDGSTDETPKVLDKIAARNDNLIVVHQSNKGSSAAINTGVEQGLRQCNAQYITIIHSDDLLTPRSLEMRVSAASKKGAKFVYTDMILLNERVGNFFQVPAPSFETGALLYSYLLRQGPLPYPTMFWERDFFTNEVQGYDPAITSAEDWDIALRSAHNLESRQEKTTHLSRNSVVNRQHDHNLWVQNVWSGVRWRCYKQIFAKHLKGWAYRNSLAKSSIEVLRAVLPEPLKVPLRAIKRSIFHHQETLNAEDTAYIRSLSQVNYQDFFSYALK
ncbi:MAG: glycosyltransferase [Nanoarchaeota archaeon]